MTEQRQNEAEPSRKPETLGEGLVLDVVDRNSECPREEYLKVLRDSTFLNDITFTAHLIDTRFAPLIDAAEAVCERMDGCGLSAAVNTLRAAIAKAKGGAQ